MGPDQFGPMWVLTGPYHPGLTSSLYNIVFEVERVATDQVDDTDVADL